MLDYGNARIAALRSRLLDAPSVRRLAESGSPAAFLAGLERSDDWRGILREAEPLFAEPQAAIERAIERHRSARLGGLVGWYDGSARQLVEALVLFLDAERVIAVIRRRGGGEPGVEVGASVIGGALLDAQALAELARAGSVGALLGELPGAGLIAPDDARLLRRGVDEHRGPRWLEDRLLDAFDRARETRAEGRGADAATVRRLLAEERAERKAVAVELVELGPAAAWLTERSARLRRLDRQAHLGRRDPLGIGTVAAYVAAVEAQAIRLRALLTRIVAAWGPETIAPFLVAGRS
jgi:vacuolar-type H+-ATPase subunit C/Vma6